MKATFLTLPQNIPLLFKERVKEIPHIYMQAARDKTGKFQYYTYREVYEKIIKLALAFRELGIKKDDNVALISDNRPEWLVVDVALLSLGAVDVPRGCDSMKNEIAFIIDYSDCVYGVFENERQVKKILEEKDSLKKFKVVIVIDEIKEEVQKEVAEAGWTLYYLEDLIKSGTKIYDKDAKSATDEIENIMLTIDKDDTATMIFTSGTTGTPKGVMLTHNNYISQLSAIFNYVYCKKGEWWLTVLPVWHSFERLIQYVAITAYCGLAYSKPQAPILLPDMAEIRPQWMCGVPRLWEALSTGVNRAMKKTGGIKYKMFRFFIRVGTAYSKMKDLVVGNLPQFRRRARVLDTIAGLIPFLVLYPWHKLGEALVYSKLKAKFGGRIEVAISGGGALQKETDDFYRAIGFSLLEGYGMSETAPVISFRDPKHPRPGVVGLIYPTMEVKIVEEEHGVIKTGEALPAGRQGLILVRSPQNMKGYYKRPDLTQKIIDKDGWLNTGDLGIRTLDNELKITGRAKDTIVLLDGENIEPSVLEAQLLTSHYIENAMIVGQDKKYLGALIVPCKEAVVNYANDNSIIYTDYEELLKLSDIQSLFSTIIAQLISQKNGFRICERIYKFALIAKPFEAGVELSAKLEIMRHKIVEIYKKEVESLFN